MIAKNQTKKIEEGSISVKGAPEVRIEGGLECGVELCEIKPMRNLSQFYPHQLAHCKRCDEYFLDDIPREYLGKGIPCPNDCGIKLQRDVDPKEVDR